MTASMLGANTFKPVQKEVAPRSMTGIGWMAIAQGSGLILRLGSNLLLSRLLAPEVYGIVGPAMAVLMTMEWFSDLGIRPALIRDPQGGTDSYLQTGWWIGLIRGVCLTAIAAGLAFPLAELYGQPELAAVLAALALLPLLQSLRSPGQPVLRRKLNYRAICADEIGQTLVAVIVTIGVALVFHSVWAIVAGTLAGAAAGIVISYIQCPVWPARSWDRTAKQRLLHVSRQVFFNSFLMALLLNSDRLLGLSLVTVEQMGLYAVAWNLAGVLDTLLSRACDVYFSALSRLVDAASREALHERICFRATLAMMPCMALGVAIAPWLIRVLYDARYAGAGTLFALLVARLMARGLGQIQFQYLLVRAEIRVATVSYGVALLAQAAMLIPFTQQWGVQGLAISALFSTTVLTVVQSGILWIRGESRLLPLVITIVWMFAGLFFAFYAF